MESDKDTLIVTVPFIASQRHLDLTIETYESLKKQYGECDNFFVINRLDDDFKNEFFEYVEGSGLFNFGVKSSRNNLARSWNIGIKQALKNGYKNILFPNLDIILGKSCIQNIVNMLNTNQYLVVSAYETHNKQEMIDNPKYRDGSDIRFSMFGINVDMWRNFQTSERFKDFETDGYFNEMFEPAYFEDNDFHYRSILAGYKSIKLGNAIFFHYGSETIKNYSDEEMNKHHESFRKNRDLYIEMWGGLPGEEKFTTPFNR